MGEYEKVRWTADCEAPLISGDWRDRPLRGELSGRWIAALSLTMVSAIALVGLALSTATSGSSYLKVSGSDFGGGPTLLSASFDGAVKADRISAEHRPIRVSDRRLMDVSTLFRSDTHDVVRKMPFVDLKMTLDGRYAGPATYPPFDPLKIFADGSRDEDTGGAGTGRIYGADVAGRINLHETDMFADAKDFGGADAMGLGQAEAEARSSAAALLQVTTADAGLPGVDLRAFRRHIACAGIAANRPVGSHCHGKRFDFRPDAGRLGAPFFKGGHAYRVRCRHRHRAHGSWFPARSKECRRSVGKGIGRHGRRKAHIARGQ